MIKIFNWCFVLFYLSKTTQGHEVCRNPGDCLSTITVRGNESEIANYTCCAFGCCTPEQYAKQSCAFDFDCPRYGMDPKLEYCCANGCCDWTHYTLHNCTSHADCPKSTETDKTHSMCCHGGCCSPKEFYAPKPCTSHVQCPGNYGNVNAEYCCGGNCCEEQLFYRYEHYCTNDDDCLLYSETNHICCDGICCHSRISGKIIGISLGIFIAIATILLCVISLARKQKNLKSNRPKSYNKNDNRGQQMVHLAINEKENGTTDF